MRAKQSSPGGTRVPRLRRKQIEELTDQLGEMIAAQVPVDRAIEITVRLARSPAVKTVTNGLLTNVRSGESLSEAFSRLPFISRLYVSMVRAGEASGALGTCLRRLARLLERESEIVAQIVQASIYPALIFLTMIAALVVLAVFAVPKLAVMFRGIDLPLTTRVVLYSGEWLATRWPIALAAVAALVGGTWGALRWEPSRRRIDSLLVSLPLLGQTVRRTSSERVARILGTLLGGGVPVLQSLDIAQGVVGNRAVRLGLSRAIERVRAGETLSAPLGAEEALHPILAELAGVGEETGRLPESLERAADILEREVRRSLDRLFAMLQPLSIIIMAVVVGIVVVSIYLPIFRMYGSIG